MILANACVENCLGSTKNSLIKGQTKVSSYISTINLHKSPYHIFLYHNRSLPSHSPKYIVNYFDISHVCPIKANVKVTISIDIFSPFLTSWGSNIKVNYSEFSLFIISSCIFNFAFRFIYLCVAFYWIYGAVQF